MSGSPILQVKDLVKTYPPHAIAIDHVSFSVLAKDFIYIMGRSGAGKTTLFRLITKQEAPDSGEIFIEDLSLASIPKKKGYRIRRKIGIVFQDFNLIEYKTVYQNVAFALEIRGYAGDYVKKQVNLALDTVGLLARQDSMPSTMSGGEQQRIAIARAIVTKPSLLLADEPTGNLDFKTSQEIISLFTRINQMGTSILMATHDLDIVAGTGRRIIVLENGKKLGENFG